MKPTWKSRDGEVQLYRADALAALRELEGGAAAVLLADPPYSSGGRTTAERQRDPTEKYEQHGQSTRRGTFAGDNRDGRSWGYWSALWLSECLRVCRAGGYAMTFTDWRQLPLATDAFQAGGFVWRGLVVWDKTEGARAPHCGYFRHQCEFLVWGTKGPAGAKGGPFPGCVRCAVRPREKLHLCGKPVEMLEQLLAMAGTGDVVLDPFMGSASTGVAALRRGLRYVGIEIDGEYFDVAVGRLRAEIEGRAA